MAVKKQEETQLLEKQCPVWLRVCSATWRMVSSGLVWVAQNPSSPGQ